MIATAPRNKMETNQDIGTDPKLFRVLHQEFSFVVDLAASPGNHKCNWWLGKGPEDTESKGGSLEVDWHRLPMGWLWLNPPFRDITPWAEKCLRESEKGARIALLTPASVDADWYDEYVHRRAEVRYLKGRPVFDFIHTKDGAKDKKTGKPRHLAGDPNTDPYPKPCMVSLFERGRFPLNGPWDWRANLRTK